eukprot:12974604-Heterocapsa_arctica.AAC.2
MPFEADSATALCSRIVSSCRSLITADAKATRAGPPFGGRRWRTGSWTPRLCTPTQCRSPSHRHHARTRSRDRLVELRVPSPTPSGSVAGSFSSRSHNDHTMTGMGDGLGPGAPPLERDWGLRETGVSSPPVSLPAPLRLRLQWVLKLPSPPAADRYLRRYTFRPPLLAPSPRPGHRWPAFPRDL